MLRFLGDRFGGVGVVVSVEQIDKLAKRIASKSEWQEVLRHL
jgi:hypothetical protein